MIQPTIGIRPIRIHHPTREVSCNRRMPTARPGRNKARVARGLITPPLQLPPSPVPRIASRMLATIDTSTVNRANHQYSERRARPLKSTYLLRQILTASENDIGALRGLGRGPPGQRPDRTLPRARRERGPARSSLLPHRQGVAERVGVV